MAALLRCQSRRSVEPVGLCGLWVVPCFGSVSCPRLGLRSRSGRHSTPCGEPLAALRAVIVIGGFSGLCGRRMDRGGVGRWVFLAQVLRFSSHRDAQPYDAEEALRVRRVLWTTVGVCELFVLAFVCLPVR